MKDEALKLLLQHKLAFLGIAAQVLMLWWVSSIAFCGSVIAGFWLRRDDFVDMPSVHYILITLTISVFLASLVAFGVWSIWSLDRLQADVVELVRRTSLESPGFAEFVGVKWAVLIGTSSFVFVFATWLTLCWHVGFLRRNKDAEPE
jgi:hypothetical protein